MQVAGKSSTKTRRGENWLAGGLRLTAFPTQPWEVETLRGWEQLVGRAPEQRQSLPREATIQENGSYGDGSLTFKADPTRVDWHYAAETEPESEDLPLNLGTFSHAVDEFGPIMKRWLRSAPPISRLAFGAILLRVVDDRARGFRQLDGYLPSVKLDPKNTRDFMYQINRRRRSKLDVKGLEINRLTKWSVAQIQPFMASTSGGDITELRTVHRGKTIYACRLEEDINTAPEFKERLPHRKLPHLFDELLDLGLEISDAGECP